MNAKQKWCVAGMISGGLLIGSPMLGLLGTVHGMMQAFQQLGRSGVGDPQQLSAAIGESLISFAAGFVLCALGMVVLILSLVFFLHARKSVGRESSVVIAPDGAGLE